ncbi:aminotransferase class V-fold PLP-dependent enzyme [Shimia sp. MMG029]|uniref:aminotransferase class V-fold PLP-dependent enzyme n=1 Tax=Shimia sp. MMG029 TaxID=3021978 RepID=UPI0022FEB7BA|nr:aminotransferase class V-fold PLP-dependent enzyme [Shimia sp. MMG029]MDA5557955.1 aminotransferase class V-fold PLP-dependent enzyme [Shimia sp. MMG029]
MSTLTAPFDQFAAQLNAVQNPMDALQAGLIGGDMMIDTPYGPRKLVYADYVASGRALRQVESFVLENVLPYYANTHTDASFCGARMGQLREGARAVVARHCGARDGEHAVIFAGSGATTGLNQLVHMMQVGAGDTVLVGPYEHHSNLLPWRESGAKVLEIPEGALPGPDRATLTKALAEHSLNGRVIVAMSAAANVTGVCTDVAAVTRLVKTYGGVMIWDYAGGGPYLPMQMTPAEGAEIDALVFSAHKCIGGPGASGVLVVREDVVRAVVPYRPGGGTVAFVNAHQHDYVAPLAQREEGGTPNVVGDIRVALALVVKEVIGAEMQSRNAALTARAFDVWSSDANLHVLAPERTERLPILSFVPLDSTGARIDHNAFTRALSERYGIQARGGCSCAGPYVHHLLQIDDANSAHIRDDILQGPGASKPGFVRLNLSVLMSDETVEFILQSVAELAQGWGAETPQALAG